MQSESVETARRAAFAGIAMSLEDFLAWSPAPDGWKYEWKDGEVIGKEESMKQNEAIFAQRFLRVFHATEAYKRGGELLAEIDCALPEVGRVRRPDLAYFTTEQIHAARAGNNAVPLFVIELVSPNDSGAELKEKLREYFASGVQSVWYVYPQAELVETYASRKKVVICSDDDVCSAAPALPDFQIKAGDVFAK